MQEQRKENLRTEWNIKITRSKD